MEINPSTSSGHSPSTLSINPIIFRSYDVRGVYPRDLNEKGVFLAASAFARLYPGAKRIVVARDSRLSSPSLKERAVKALVEQGREVIDIGLAPDSLFSFSINHYGFEGGIMVSASHNPKKYNGLIFNFEGLGIAKESLVKIKEMVLTGEIKRAKDGGEITPLNPEKDYISYVIKKIKLKRPLKIIFDSGNGAVGYLPEKVFQKLGCQTKTIFGRPDGHFPNHPPDPYLEENLKDLKAKVLEEKADIGFAFDGDGDRVIMVDNQGRRVLEDYCLLLLAKKTLEKYKGSIVHGMRVSDIFLNEIKKMGIKTHFSVCHHNAIIEKIKKTEAVFGGEITSHYFFPKDYYLSDDALFSALKLAEIVSQDKDFAQQIDGLPRIYASPEVFIETPEEKKFLIIEKLKKHLEKEKIDFIGVDGARIQFENGWALARASNTSPYVKLRFEGRSQKDLKEIKKKAAKLFQKAGLKI